MTFDTSSQKKAQSQTLVALTLTAANEIRTLHAEILDAARTTLAKAQRIGELLVGIKAGLDHGQWLPWVADNLPFKERTARNYIRVFEKRDELKSATVADLSDAYALLSETAPDGVVTAAAHGDVVARKKKATPSKPNTAEQLAKKAIVLLEQIPDDNTERDAALQLVKDWIEKNQQTAKQKFKCDSCEETFDDDVDGEPLYECGNCGTTFTRNNSADAESHRCPGCNKFGSKLSDLGCPSCGEGELEEVEAGR